MSAFGHALVVFDWDGTVIDSIEGIASAIQLAASDLGLRVPSDAQAREVIGLGLHDALRSAVPDLSPDRMDEFVARYRVHFFAAPQVETAFRGIGGLLEALKGQGRTLAVATGKSRRGLDRAFDSTGLGRFFSASRCADEGWSKPNPWMLEALSEELNVPRHEMLMIGDTTHDLGMARNFGCACIGVLYGAHDRQSVLAARPDGVASTVDELAALLGIGDGA